MPVLDKATTPREIEARSFEIIESEIPEPRPFSGELWQVARRCIHALGDPAILPDLRLSAKGLENGLEAMQAGCRIFTDTAMLAEGLVSRRMKPLGIDVVPLMRLEGLSAFADQRQITRAAAGMELIADQFAGQIVAIGNAPTALLTLLFLLEKGASPPALIVGMPVGFVNAAQSKEILSGSVWPHFTLLGRKGGSAVAAASLNAVADLALARQAD